MRIWDFYTCATQNRSFDVTNCVKITILKMFIEESKLVHYFGLTLVSRPLSKPVCLFNRSIQLSPLLVREWRVITLEQLLSKVTNTLSEALCYLEYFGIRLEPMFTFYFKSACPQTPDTYTDDYKYRKI